MCIGNIIIDWEYMAPSLPASLPNIDAISIHHLWPGFLSQFKRCMTIIALSKRHAEI
jgi:hypothetical protein